MSREIRMDNDHLCSAIPQGELDYSELQIKEGHKSLSNFLSWVRVHPKHWTIKNMRSGRTISLVGYSLLFFPLTIFIVGFISLLVSITFYYIPDWFSYLYAMITPDYHIEDCTDIEVIEQTNYYKEMRNDVNKVNLFQMYFLRFSTALICLVIMMSGLFIINSFDQKPKCAMAEAADQILDGKGTEFFGHFSLKNNHTLFNDLIIDLENLDHKQKDYEALINSDISSSSIDFETALSSFYKSLEHKTLPGCRNFDRLIIPQVEDDFKPLLSRDNKDDLEELIQFSTNMQEGVKFLKNEVALNNMVIPGLEQSIKVFNDKVNTVNKAMIFIYSRLNWFFINYYSLMRGMSILMIIYSIYMVGLLLPATRCEIFSRSVQVILLQVGALVIGGLGTYLFIRSQELVKGCILTHNFLNHANHSSSFLGKDDSHWLKTCVMKNGTGDITSFLNDTDTYSFYGGLSILRAFSQNTTILDVMQGNELGEVEKYSQVLEAYGNYSQDNFNKIPDQSFSNVRDEVNKLIECTSNEVRLNQDNCKEKKAQDVISGSDNNTNSLCYLPSELVGDIKGRYDNTCVDDSTKVGKLLKSLKQCFTSHNDYLENCKDYFNQAHIQLRKFIGVLKKAEKPFKRIRKQFQNAVVKYDKIEGDIGKITDCRDMRRLARMVLGNTCYENVYTYGSFWLSATMMVSAYFIIILSYIACMEGLVDPRVYNKYMQVNKNGDDDEKVETEMTKIGI